jgi:hypothetical protein
MGVNTHILSGRRNSTKLAVHAAGAASFNPKNASRDENLPK